MAQYWYKKEKRVKRVSEQHDDKKVVKQVAELKAAGYVRVLDRRFPERSIVEEPKPTPPPAPKAIPKPAPKPKAKVKTKSKSKAKKKKK